MISGKEVVIPLLKENIFKCLCTDTGKELEEIDSQIKDKQTELLKAGIDTKLSDSIGDEILALRDKKQEIMIHAAMNVDMKKRIEDMDAFLNEQRDAITSYSEALVRKLIEKVTIYDEKIVVEFKSGMKTEVNA